LLVCSDGLDMLLDQGEHVIAALLAQERPLDQLARTVLEAALHQATDNVSVILIRCR